MTSPLIKTLLLGTALLTVTARAAVVTWSTSEINSSTEMLGGNTGLVQAYNFRGHNTSPGQTYTVNMADGAVLFDTIYPGGSNGGFSNANVAGGADINTVLNGSQFSSSSVTIGGLTAGDSYRMQILGYAANFAHVTDITLDGQFYNDWVIDTSSDNTHADLMTATWIQEAGETSVTVSFTQNPQIAGLVLHSVTDENAAATTVPNPGLLALMVPSLFGMGLVSLRRNRSRYQAN